MAKLGEQLESARSQPMTRTKSLIQRRDRQREIAKINEQIKQSQTFLGESSTIDEYEQKYNQLSPDMKQYFSTPSQLREERQKKIDNNLSKADEQIVREQKRIQTIQQKIKHDEDWWSGLSSEQRPRYRDSYKRNISRYEEDIDESNYEISFWNEAKGKYLSKGYSFSDAGSWVSKNVRYRLARADEKRRALKTKNELEKKLADPKKIRIITQSKNGKVLGRKIYYTGGETAELLGTQKAGDVSGGWNTGLTLKKEKIQIGDKTISFKSGQPVFKVEKSNIKPVYFSPFGDVKVTESKTSDIDTSITLRERENKTPSVVSAWVPPTDEEIYHSKLYSDGVTSKITKNIGSWWGDFKRRYGMSRNEPQIKMVKVIKPTATGERGTAEITYEFTPETKREVETQIKFGLKAEMMTSKILEDYETNIKNIKPEGLTQKKVDVFKEEALSSFQPQIRKLKDETQKGYEGRLKKEKREKRWMVEELPLQTITALRQGYWWAEDTAPKVDKWLINKGLPEDIFSEEPKSFGSDWGYSTYKGLKGLGYSEPVSFIGSASIIQGQGFVEGAYDTLRKENVLLGYKAGLWAGGTAVATVAVGSIPPIALAGSLVPKTVSGGLKYSVLGLYGGSIAIRSLLKPTYFSKGYELGKITTSEVLPMYAGTLTGVKLGGKALRGIEELKIWKEGAKWRSPSKITRIEVLRGEQRFPEASPSSQTKIFAKQAHALPDDIKEFTKLAKRTKGGIYVYKTPSGYHSTPSGRFGELTKVGKGSSEVPALYISEEGSINFLKLGTEYGVVGSSWLPKVSSPSMPRIQTAGIKKIPKTFKGKYTSKELQKLLGKEFKIKPSWARETEFILFKAEKGYGYLPLRKAEIEAVIRFDTLLKKQPLKTPYYTRIAKPEFYKSLEAISRKGNIEYVRRVQKFSLSKPSTYVDKILGKQAGWFKTTKVGKAVPIDRYLALTAGQEKELLGGVVKESVKKKILEKKGVTTVQQFSKKTYSSYQPSRVYASYPSSYLAQLISSYSSKKKKSSKKISYGVSSYTSSLISSSIKSASSSSSASSSMGSSLGSYSYSSPSSPSYSSQPSYPSYPSYPPYLPPSIPVLFPPLGKAKKKKKRLKDSLYGELYIPDFTTRAIGLDALKLDKQRSKKLLKQIQTGLEIRRGVKLT